MVVSRLVVDDLDRGGGCLAGCSCQAAGFVRGVDGDGAFDHAGVAASAPVRHEVIKDLAADHADQIDNGVRGGGEDAQSGGELVTGGVEAGAVGIDRVGSGRRR